MCIGPLDTGGNSSVGVVVGVVITLLLLIVIAIVIILVLLFLHIRKRDNSIVSRRKSSVNDYSSEMQQRLTKEDIEWQIPHIQNGTASDAGSNNLYATLNKEDPPPIPTQNFFESDTKTNTYTHVTVYAEAKNAYTDDPQNVYNKAKEDPQTVVYDEAKPQRRMTNSSAPKLAKLMKSGSAVMLNQNPIYESTGNIAVESDTQALVEPESSESVAIYAQPSYKRKNPPSKEKNGEPVYSEALTPALFKEPASANDTTTLHPYGPIYAEPTSLLKKTQKELKVLDFSNFQEQRVIGIGQFGEVVLAQTVGLSRSDLGLTPADNDRNVHILVAIKKLRTDAENPVRDNFEKEIKFMSRLNDENIISLLAIGGPENPFIVMEYMENGDLHQFLEEYESVVTSDSISEGEIPVSILVYMTLQIASGMKYLASHNYVHRDLATRNCLVGKDFVVKIADFGMSRNLYQQSYYKVRGRAMLPIRWMASESFFGRFSEKTDVWSFGVVMWEIFSLCKLQPYEDLDDQDIIQDAIKGEGRILLERPEACPESVYDVMLRCWLYNTQARAGFGEVFNSLSAIYQTLL